PLTSNAFLVTAKMSRAHGGLPAAILIRGVDARAGAIWPRMRVIHGRLFRPGLDEVVVGRQAQQLFGKLALGDTFAWNNRNWKVVGVFADNGSSHESEIWADVHQLQADYSATNKYTDIYARLTSPAVFGTFKHALENNPQLNVNVTRESTNIKASAAGLSALITDAGSLVTLLMAIGAIFGAVNIMYSGIAARQQDIATLRSLGFRRLPVLSVVLLEGLALGLAGGILGAAVAYLIFNGYPAATLGNYVLVAFQFAVTPGLMLAGILIAAAMGLVGGLFPAIQVGRMPIATALRGS
ncbi:MAG: ABC transporter permease, partial [Gammaproteobacteria bacterium]|nr:ABC transporter permease [Gammaproteobacteria bacterium]